jgi:Arc/MetJ-type ribon-helix-helix transcriptional regulator
MTYRHTAMGKSKIAITLAEKTVRYLDEEVKRGRFANRSQAVQEAVDDKLARLRRSRLAEECAKLNRAEERQLAEEGLDEDATRWPEY